MSTDEQFEEKLRSFYQEVSSDRLRDWLMKPENKPILEEVEGLYSAYSEDLTEAKRMAVKGLLLKELASLQGDQPKMELAMILVQLGLTMMDWARLEEDLGV